MIGDNRLLLSVNSLNKKLETLLNIKPSFCTGLKVEQIMLMNKEVNLRLLNFSLIYEVKFVTFKLDISIYRSKVQWCRVQHCL